MKEWSPNNVPAYWQEDREVGQVRLQGETYGLHLRTHTVTERYEPSPRRELVPLTAGGRATTVIGQVYVLEPRRSPLSRWRRLTQQPEPLRPRDLETVRIGDLHAVAYDADRTLVLWDCSLLPAYQEAEPALDPNLRALWRRTEELLTQRFPGAGRVITPAWDPGYDPVAYRAFLRDIGYRRLSPYAFARQVLPTPAISR